MRDSYRDWFLLTPGVQVTEPDLHWSIWPGGAEGVGGEDSVRSHSVPPLGLGHQPVEDGGIPQPTARHSAGGLEEVPGPSSCSPS